MPSLYDRFNLVSDFELAGDQQRAIGKLTDGLDREGLIALAQSLLGKALGKG